jgi:hypothetical protein
MRSRSGENGRIARVSTVSLVAVGFTALALAASAASLGGITVGTIFTQESPVTIDIPDPPRPLVFTDFSGCQNSLDGWTDESGATWLSHSGNWQCLGNDVARAQQRVPLAHTTVGIPYSTGLRISTHIYDISNQNNRSGPGIALLGDGNGGLVYVRYERDKARIVIGHSYAAGNGSAIFPYSGDLESGTMVVDLVGPNLTVKLAGQNVGSYVVPAFAMNKTRFGLVANNDNQSRFDSFTIELLP